MELLSSCLCMASLRPRPLLPQCPCPWLASAPRQPASCRPRVSCELVLPVAAQRGRSRSGAPTRSCGPRAAQCHRRPGSPPQASLLATRARRLSVANIDRRVVLPQNPGKSLPPRDTLPREEVQQLWECATDGPPREPRCGERAKPRERGGHPDNVICNERSGETRATNAIRSQRGEQTKLLLGRPTTPTRGRGAAAEQNKQSALRRMMSAIRFGPNQREKHATSRWRDAVGCQTCAKTSRTLKRLEANLLSGERGRHHQTCHESWLWIAPQSQMPHDVRRATLKVVALLIPAFPASEETMSRGTLTQPDNRGATPSSTQRETQVLRDDLGSAVVAPPSRTAA